MSRRKKLKVYNADISNDVYMDGIMTNNDVKAVVHCAADISVPESMDNPLKYYENNVGKNSYPFRTNEKTQYQFVCLLFIRCRLRNHKRSGHS